MATTTINAAPATHRGVLAVLAAPVRAVLMFLVHMAEANPRMRAIQKLQAMSDEELAARGLTRETIVQHVFRDSLYV